MRRSTAVIGCGVLSLSLTLTICYLLLNEEAKDSVRSLYQMIRDKGKEAAEAKREKELQQASRYANREKTLDQWKAIGY